MEAKLICEKGIQTENPCKNAAVYFNYDKREYICPVHAEEAGPMANVKSIVPGVGEWK